MSELKHAISKGKKRGESEWDDWGGYMRMKIRKLDEQFELIKTDDAQNNILSNLFKDVVIFVNGYTIPSSDELKRLMKKHGGGFQHYYSRTKCTHIVATNLPDSKIKELRGEKVVHPNWITDSIREGKLLPYREYLLYGVGRKYSENNKPKGSLMKFVTARDAISGIKLDGNSVHNKDKGETSGRSSLTEDTSCTTKHIDSNVEKNPGVQTSDINCTSICAPLSSRLEVDRSGVSRHNSSLDSCSTGLANGCNPTVPETACSLRSVERDRKMPPKAGDPNFLSEFYSHSRLHYLSTWGAEFREFINNLIATTELKAPKRSPLKNPSKKRIIMHIDMDSFFVSVTLRDRPELKGKPVAVCHAGRGSGTSTTSGSDNSSSFGSTSEIASCSYEARACGVKNGMWLGQARKLCPDIVCVPYQFQQYREVSQKLYEILASYTHEIQAVSCDEAFVDVTHYVETERITPLQLAQCIRDEILSKTRCPASAGLGPNILLARMCTKVAKPNGQVYLQSEDVQEFIKNKKAKDLPGVGHSLGQKLEALNVVTCLDLQRFSLQVLRREFGHKTGEMLYKYCRGEDDRQLTIERERKSISAEINYAIRFEEDSEPEKFIHDLSKEVHRRMKSAGVKGKHLTFKVRVRQKDAPINPVKFMGCGRCDNISRSVTMNSYTDDPNIIAKECIMMLKLLGVPVSDMRGIGIQVSKLAKDERMSSSLTTKTIHDFMKPSSNKVTASSTTASDDHLVGSTSVSDNKNDGPAVSSGLKNSSFFTTKLPSNSIDTVVQRNVLVTRRDDVITTNDGSVASRGIGEDRTTEENLGEDRDIIVRDHDDFSLALSDDEFDEHALDTGQLNSDGRLNAPTCTFGQRSTKKGEDGPRAKVKADFPPLPVFPIFSPPRSPGRSNQKSPGRSNQRSPGRSNQRSPGRSNQRSPRRSNQRSPGRSNQRSVCRSPGRLAQRSLYSSFHSPRAREVGSSLSLPSPSQIDRAVFDALPEEIKKDIENSYQQRNQKFSLRTIEASDTVQPDRSSVGYQNWTSPSEIDPGVFEALPEEIKKDIEKSYLQRNQKLPSRDNVTGNVGQVDQLQIPSPSHWDPEVIRCLPSEITNSLRQECQKTVKKPLIKQKNLTKKKTMKSSTSTKTGTAFKSLTKNSTLSSKKKSNTTPQLDPSLLDALPECLRHEAQLAYEQQRRHDEKEKNKRENISTITNALSSVEVQNPRDDDSIVMVTKSLPKVSLAGAETLTKIREMLKLWTDSTQVPLDEDVNIFVEFLGNLVDDKDLEKMWIVLRFFRRLVAQKKTWHVSFNNVLHSTQGILKETYGSQLPVDFFEI